MLVFYSILGVYVLLVWPLLVLLHELGHAVPALLFTRQGVTLYLGSYGDKANSWRVQAGPLEVYIKRSPFWSGGLCVYTEAELTKGQRAVILLGGVIVSLAIAALGFYGALALNLHGAVKLFLFFLVIFAAYTFVLNLLPIERGGIPSDGLQLKWLLLGNRPPATAAFSPELRALISQARIVAIDLGYKYVSTLHLLLADCAMPYPFSLRGLLFAQDNQQHEQYTAFYERYRAGPAQAAGSLPISVSFEQALQLAGTYRDHGLRADHLTPGHLLLAAASLPGSELGQVLRPSTPAELVPELLTYYQTFAELLAPLQANLQQKAPPASADEASS